MFKYNRKQWTILMAFMAATATLAYCTPLDWFRSVDFELTGKVLDEDTEQPIEGAYVMAVSYGYGGSLAGSASWCVKTVGMYTDKAGNFHFPVEKRAYDAYSPQTVQAIKPGYFANLANKIPHEGNAKERYTGWKIYLAKQDPAKSDYTFGGEVCGRPESREAAEANIVSLKIAMNEVKRMRKPIDVIENYERLISRLESTPAAKIPSTK